MATPSAATEQHTHHGHHPHLQHHFVSMEQQFSTAKLGMWLFLITEILLFSGMFVAYAVFRYWYPEIFHVGHHFLDVHWGAINTIVLLTSSWTVVMAISSIQHGDQKKLVAFLVATVALALIFMGIKYIEYSHKIHEGLLPGAAFSYPVEELKHLIQETLQITDNARIEAIVSRIPIFFTIYFVMTAIHGLHVLGGIIVISWLAYKAKQGTFDPMYYGPIEVTGLYWHLVDIIWIFLFPLLYLAA